MVRLALAGVKPVLRLLLAVTDRHGITVEWDGSVRAKLMNNRKFTRVCSHIPVDVAASGTPVSGEVRDISFEGLRMPTTAPLPEQTLSRVTIHLAETIKIRANGAVVRSEPDGFAVQFVELLDLESYGHLRNVIPYNSHGTARHGNGRAGV